MSNLLPVDTVFHGVHSAKMPTADSVAVLKRMLASLLLQSTLNRTICYSSFAFVFLHLFFYLQRPSLGTLLEMIN